MTKEEMEQVSNETLADYMTPKRGNEFSQAPWDFNVTNHDLAMAEIARRVRNGMYWQPMTEDAVFDRSESMLFRLAKYDTTDASGIYHGTYLDMVETYRPFITHYARITEPK